MCSKQALPLKFLKKILLLWLCDTLNNIIFLSSRPTLHLLIHWTVIFLVSIIIVAWWPTYEYIVLYCTV
jgi:hypothetical protein